MKKGWDIEKIDLTPPEAPKPDEVPKGRMQRLRVAVKKHWLKTLLIVVCLYVAFVIFGMLSTGYYIDDNGYRQPIEVTFSYLEDREDYGLESTFRNFVFGVITSGFFKYAQGHEGGFLAEDQFETVVTIEEANEVLIGSDTAGTGNPSMPSFGGQSEFERILDQAAGLGLFIFSITQKIADMPSSVIANSGLIFAGKISRPDDVMIVIRKIGREERYDDRDILKWLPRSPIGWFVCRSSRNYDFKDVEPVLVKVDPLNIDPPSNFELETMMIQKQALQLLD